MQHYEVNIAEVNATQPESDQWHSHILLHHWFWNSDMWYYGVFRGILCLILVGMQF